MLKEISIEIIRKCPNRCLHCSSSAHSQCTEVLPYDKFKALVSDAAELGATTICLSGGEPFLHNEITSMLEWVHTCGLNSYVYTSGIMLDSSGAPIALPEDLLQRISGSATKVIFNIEAGTEKTYDRIMGTKNCFEKMQESALRAAKAGICTEAHFVPMAININELDDVIVLCKKLKISKLSFLRLVMHGRAKQNREEIALSSAQYTALKSRLHTLQSESEFSLRVGVPLSLDTSCHRCEAAKGKLNIKYDGEVFPCEVFKNYSMEKSLHGLKPDNIYHRSLLDIYNHSEYLHHIRKLSEDFSKNGNCETCIGQYLIDLEEKGVH